MEKGAYIVDRIEGDYTILETYDGFIKEIKSNNIQGCFKEGDVLLMDGEFFKVSEELTKERREKIENLMKDMWK
ncbi:MAG: DUF3006 domain-containing protein [Clostridium sp.]|nr:DUF3006 domain-containing protein [Clostridium sp.]